MPAQTLHSISPINKGKMLTTPTPTKRTPTGGGRITMEQSPNQNSNSRLLQLAERSNPRKTPSHQSPASHLLSFRKSSSPSPSNPPSQIYSTFARRNTTTPKSFGLGDSQGSTSISPSVRQNAKLYTSFSSKSSSKLRKAFIKSDPLKTNIEHLVASPIQKKDQQESPSHSPNSSADSNSSGVNHYESSSNKGLSNFITPLKALHASFHDRSKLSTAFAPRNTRLFSQRDNSKGKVARVTGGNENRDKSPDFLEYFGNTSPVTNNNNNIANNSSTPDILEDCLSVDSETNYIILERGRREENNSSNKRVSETNYTKSNYCYPTRMPKPIEASSSRQEERKRSVIKSGTDNNNPFQISNNNNNKDEDAAVNANLHTNNYKDPEDMRMSTATPMKITSSSASRAQIIKLMPRSSPAVTPHMQRMKDNTKLSAGVLLNSKKVPVNHHDDEEIPSGKNLVGGSTFWANSNTKSNHVSQALLDLDYDEFCREQEELSEIESIPPKTNSNLGVAGTGLAAKMNERRRLNDNDEANYSGSPAIENIDSGNYVKFLQQQPISNLPIIKRLANNNNNSNPVNGERKPKPNNKTPRQSQKRLFQSLSFRQQQERRTNNGCGYLALENEDEEENFVQRHRSRSLPKSFMGKTTTKDAVPLRSLWTTEEEILSERLAQAKENKIIQQNQEYLHSPASSTNSEELDISKMRWQKSAASSSSSSSSSLQPDQGQRRPKSFDYSQRKAWMKYYREMEISSVSSKPSHKGGISKGSISHLHLLDSKEDLPEGHPNPSPHDMTQRPPENQQQQTPGLTPSLFQRFSKTFSLRFGSTSSVNKIPHQQQQERCNKQGGKAPMGSSPDLHNRFEESESGKMRKVNSKSIRGEKCQSGDSGIGIEEPRPHPSNSRLRRIRSEYIENPSSSSSSRNSAILTTNGQLPNTTSAMTKMSLVEIPNHVWEQEKKKAAMRMRRKAVTGSYEDVLESTLDGEGDDGFSSGDDDSGNSQNGTCVDFADNGRKNNPAYHNNSNNFHSLPHKSSRKNKNSLSVLTQNNGQHQQNVVQGRSKSLEDDESAENHNATNSQPPVEDNSIRGKVIREIIITEQNYVKTLNDIVQGFLNPCRARKDLFSGEVVRNIFSNIEDILRLHARFLDAMKEKINPTAISRSNIGKIFTEWADYFDLYSEYCCNNPISILTVRSLMQSEEYSEFFEACRRLQLMDKLPLHGFLLRPIQRICQYHLQLTELLKQTEESHQDYPTVVEAVETMKSVALKINESQRQFDSLQEIIRLQNSIEGWEGSDLLNRNSTVLIKGDLVKMAVGKRNKEVFCVLLNKDLVYCKKDYIKKGGYVFDGRIDLEVGCWLNIDSNEEDEYFGMVHNSWRIFSPELKTWLLFTTPSPNEKRKWITALENSVTVRPVDPKMCEMAKLITVLSDDNRPSQSTSSSHYSLNSNTLPKSSKKSKAKQQTRIDAEAMLIEVSKLKARPNYLNGSAVNGFNKDNRGSKFYV